MCLRIDWVAQAVEFELEQPYLNNVGFVSALPLQFLLIRVRSCNERALFRELPRQLVSL